MDSNFDSRVVTRMEIVDTGRRRRWSDSEKLRIVGESYSGPRMGSATARQNGISNQLLHLWRKAAREGRLGRTSFVPAMIVPDIGLTDRASPATAGRMEIVGTNGRKVVVDRNVDVEALVRVVRALEQMR